MNIPIYIKRISLCCAVSLVLLPGIHAQEPSGGPLLLHFRLDKTAVDSRYMDNGKALGAFHTLFSNSTAASLIDTIFITAYASPEGDKTRNIRLAEQRANAVKAYLRAEYRSLEHRCILTDPQGENWEGLRDMVEEDHSVPDREEVLMILNDIKDRDRCKVLLKRLNCGYAYAYIQYRILPRLHATVCTVRMKDAKGIALTGMIKENARGVRLDADAAEVPMKKVAGIIALPTTSPMRVTKRPLFALKTNLLFDAYLAPNVEIEVPLGRRWSVNGELMFPWWLVNSGKYCLQILTGGLEARYWTGTRKRRMSREVLTGHFIGLYAGGGKYDLQWEEKGYQGEFFIAAGISYGFAHKIARNLRMEYNLGIGVLHTDYRHYHTRDNYKTLLWQENGTYTWFGPTKVKISLVWLLNRKVKKGGAR